LILADSNKDDDKILLEYDQRERLELVMMVVILIIGGWYYGLLLAANCSFCSRYFFDYFTEHKILQYVSNFTVKLFF